MSIFEKLRTLWSAMIVWFIEHSAWGHVAVVAALTIAFGFIVGPLIEVSATLLGLPFGVIALLFGIHQFGDTAAAAFILIGATAHWWSALMAVSFYWGREKRDAERRRGVSIHESWDKDILPVVPDFIYPLIAAPVFVAIIQLLK